MQTQPLESSLKKPAGSHYTLQECIENCLSCFQACEDVLVKGINNQRERHSAHLILVRSCAEVCNLSAKMMIMESPVHTKTCELCSVICQECADACESMSDASLKACIEACRRCAASCGEMSHHLTM